jgi:hypothetical protein
VRFHAALILLRHGDRTQLEGLGELEAILTRRKSTESYARALGVLLATGNERALKVACGARSTTKRSTCRSAAAQSFGGSSSPAAPRPAISSSPRSTTTPRRPRFQQRADEAAALVADWRPTAPATTGRPRRPNVRGSARTQAVARPTVRPHPRRETPRDARDADDPPTGGWRIDAP